MRRALLSLIMIAAVLALGPVAPAHAQYQPGQCGFLLDPAVVDPGGTTTVIGSGAPPGSSVEISVDGEVVAIAPVANDEVGSFEATITAPSDSGDYTVTVECGAFSLTQILTVTPTSCEFAIVGAPGAPVNASVPGFRLGSAYTLIFQSDPVQVGQGTVSADPQPISFSIPSDAVPGPHTLSIAGTGTNGRAKVLDCPATVTAAATTTQAGSLPRTGSDAAMLIRWGIALLAVGGLLGLAARRRSSRTA